MVEELTPQCSAKGCRASASWSLLWNNPKLHDPAYRKTWLACDEHRETLGDFLGARRFLREVTTFPAPSSEPTPFPAPSSEPTTFPATLNEPTA